LAQCRKTDTPRPRPTCVLRDGSRLSAVVSPDSVYCAQPSFAQRYTLLCRPAKWIFENVNRYTTVRFFGGLLRSGRTFFLEYGGWRARIFPLSACRSSARRQPAHHPLPHRPLRTLPGKPLRPPHCRGHPPTWCYVSPFARVFLALFFSGDATQQPKKSLAGGKGRGERPPVRRCVRPWRPLLTSRRPHSPPSLSAGVLSSTLFHALSKVRERRGAGCAFRGGRAGYYNEGSQGGKKTQNPFLFTKGEREKVEVGGPRHGEASSGRRVERGLPQHLHDSAYERQEPG
jgi:hypothetical protein